MQRYIVAYDAYMLLKRELQALSSYRSWGTRRESGEWEEMPNKLSEGKYRVAATAVPSEIFPSCEEETTTNTKRINIC